MLPLILIAALAVPLGGDRSIAWDVAVAGPRQARVPVAIDADGPFESAAVSWSAAGDSGVTIRTSADGASWSEPLRASIDQDSSDPSSGRHQTAIVHFGSPARAIELSFDTAAERVMVTFFPPARPQRDVVRTSSYQIGTLNIRSRTDWGCPDGEGARWTPGYTTVTHAVVHHTAGANSVPDWEAEVRSIWYLHTFTNGWGDIGYNFLIDPNGTIYEGRAGGDGAIGAHFSCRNSNTVGISLLGTYTSVMPTDPAMASLQRLLRELCHRLNIDPTATVYHVPTASNLPSIMGHRDGNNRPGSCTVTECPGNMLYAALPAIRSAVACTPAAIVAQPGSAAIAPQQPATLTITAAGSEPLSYQWYAGDVGSTASPVDGGTGATLTVNPAATTHYWARVSNACGSVDSEAGVVWVGTQLPRRRAAKP